jgi:hypothetical protein
VLDVAVDVVLIVGLVFLTWLNIVVNHWPLPTQLPVPPPAVTELA